MTLPAPVYALSIFMFVAFMNACVKALGHDVPVSLVLTCRFAVGLLMLSPLVYRMGGLRRTLRTNHPYRQAYRAILSTAGVGLSLYAVPMMPLADGTTLWQTYGFFLLLLSGLVTGEKIHPAYYATCALGFCGVMLIVHPDGDTPFFPAVLMLVSACMGAITTLTVRVVSRKDHELTIMTWFFSISLLLSGAWYAFLSPHPTLSMTQWFLLLGAGFFGTCSQLCMTRAFKMLGADAIGPYTYSGIVFSTVLGLMFFDEVPTLWMLGGAACIVLAIQLNHHLTRRLKPPAIST